MKKSNPATKGDISFTHNLYDILGMTLLEGARAGRLNIKGKEDLISANLGIDLGSGYGASLGYNQYMPGDRERKQNLLLNITKDF